MRGPLQGIKRRVEQLAAGVQFGPCDGVHVKHKLSSIWGDDAPLPVWEESKTPETCACGREFEYQHTIHRYVWADDPQGEARD